MVSPRAAALYHLTDRVSVWGDVGGGFRAPTLNELYRQFRVGTVLTLANNQLGPERLVGGEAGVNVSPFRRVTWRTTWFDNRISNPVSNVTIATVVEMVHMATLVHDDVLDEAELRRKGATINHLRGNEAAVLLGDYLISHSYHLCSSLDSQQASRTIARTTNQSAA